MTKNLTVSIKINGQVFSNHLIGIMEYRRALHVMAEMHDLGAKLIFHGQPLSMLDMQLLSAQDLKQALIETKAQYSDEQMLALYEKPRQQSDAFWKAVAAKSRDRQNLKAAIVDMDVSGITTKEFLAYNAKLNATGDSHFAAKINPEHLVFSAENGSQNVFENQGIVLEPTYFRLDLLSPKDFAPIPVDKDVTFAMGCEFFLQSDGSKMKMYGMHQFTDTADGMKIKLGIFFPEATPDYAIWGHQEHLATEFLNSMKLIANDSAN